MFAMKQQVIMMVIMMIVVTVSSQTGNSGYPAPGPCWKCIGEGVACGDPHMMGFDGKAFDIWSAGDYLVLKESDGFEISFTVRNRWGAKSSPWITEIRCRGPGGPWMKVTAATAAIPNSPDGPIEATVFVDGVGTVDNGDSYTDPTTALRVHKSVQGSSIAFVAPRWTLNVDHKVAHVVKDGWHYLNMGISISSLLETPVTGVLGVTYNPDTYARILQKEHRQNQAASSHAVADHSSSSRALLFKSATSKPHAVVVYNQADETEFLQSTTLPGRKLKQTGPSMCCGLTQYDDLTQICCQGQINFLAFSGKTLCCGTQSYAEDQFQCCPGNIIAAVCQ
jgi:hypothetical protein